MLTGRILFQEPSFNDLKKSYSFVDMHVHSKYSHDCVTPISSLIARAKKLGIGLAITDHLRAEGAIEACKQKKVLVIPGIEIASIENKEILLYFYSANDLKDYYDKYIKNKLIHKKSRTGITKAIRAVRSKMSMNEIIEKADKYDCLKSIPHPYCYLNRSSNIFFARKKRADLLKRIEAVEVLDSARRKFMNEKAMKWAIKRKKSFTGGSDAHSLNELGKGIVASKANTIKDFLDSIIRKDNLVIGKEIKFPTALKALRKLIKDKRNNDLSKINNL